MWAYRPNQTSRRVKKKVGPKFIRLFVIVFAVLLVSWATIFFYLRHEVQKLSRQEKALLATKTLLQKKVERLEKGDLSAYEEVARQKYGLIKKNERLIIFKN